VVVSVGAEKAWLREGSKRDSSTAQTDSFAGANEEEKSVCYARNEMFCCSLERAP
jgi:hypothetical protein